MKINKRILTNSMSRMNAPTKKVIIPRFSQTESREEYFVPRYVKIKKGDTVEWINTDTKPHTLVILFEERERVGPIEPNQVARLKFDYQIERIDYQCGEHPNERGTIVIFPDDEDKMSNTDRLRFLSRVFEITPPAINAALDLKQQFVEVKSRWSGIWSQRYNVKLPINLKCGIHTCQPLFGLFQSGDRNQITGIGSAVNFANRLEGEVARRNQIIISPQTKKKSHHFH